MNAAGLHVWNAAEPPDRDLPEWNPPTGPVGVDPRAGRPTDGPAWDGSPVPLGARRLLPVFPVDALPSWVGDCVAAVAESTQTPVDLACCVALACLSTAAGGKAVVTPRDGWTEQVNIYTVTALPPGSRKSAVFRAMTRPLMEAEKALADAAGPARVEAEVARRVARAKAEDAAKKAEQASIEHQLAATAAATDAALDADSIRVPVTPQLVADDITPEAAASLLADQGGRLSVLSAEGGIFATLAGRYSGQPNFELFLKAHPGDMLRVTRKGRDAEDVDHPALTLGIATQPHTLTEIARVPGFRDRGLIARFLWSLPENTVGRRKVGTPPPPAELLTTYSTTLRVLVLTLAERPEPLELRLTPDAVDALVQLEEWVEPQLDPRGGALATITDWASKFCGAVLRIAGLLHLAEHLNDGYAQPITLDTFRAAERIGRYYLAHALAVFDLMGADPDLDDARHVLDWITRAGRPSFTRRDLFNEIRSQRFAKVTDLYPALELLLEHGYIREHVAEKNPRGGRPSVAYDVHPAVHHRAAKPAEPAKP